MLPICKPRYFSTRTINAYAYITTFAFLYGLLLYYFVIGKCSPIRIISIIVNTLYFQEPKLILIKGAIKENVAYTVIIVSIMKYPIVIIVVEKEKALITCLT